MNTDQHLMRFRSKWKKIDGVLVKAESNECSELIIFYKILLTMKNKDMIRSSQVL